MVKQTKFKMAIGLIALALLEAIIKTIWKEFPLTELYAFEGLVGGWFMGTQVRSDANAARYACADPTPPKS